MNDFDLKKTANELGIDCDTLIMLLDMFAESLGDEIQNIRQAVQSNNLADIHKFAHGLKGSAANLRFKELAECCRILESNAKTGADIDYKKAFENLEKVADSTEKSIKNING